ncbi:MAG TPA: FkbM family methyltransferase [Sphingomicrobium sp.]|nr:FkbM family methyltransferase [Sphingomicrobium sp.]
MPLLRPLWTRLHRLSLVGLNYWASEFSQTGEREALAFVSRRLRGQHGLVIFDVGANVGEFTKACLAQFGPHCVIHAFEPSAATFADLESNLRGQANVRLHPFGFSDSEREADLYSSEPGSTIASVHRLQRPVRPFRDEFTERVSLTKVDLFCRKEGIESIDLLKLDVEGHELMVLQGATEMVGAGRVGFIQFEFGENNISSKTYLADFHAMLGSTYKMYQILPGGPVPWSYEGSRSEIFATMNYLCERVDGGD